MRSNASPSGSDDQAYDEDASSSKFGIWNIGHSGNSPEPDEFPPPPFPFPEWLEDQALRQQERYDIIDAAHAQAAEGSTQLSDPQDEETSGESPAQSSTGASALDSTSSNSQRVEGDATHASPHVSHLQIDASLSSIPATPSRLAEGGSAHAPRVPLLEIAPVALASTSAQPVEGGTRNQVTSTSPLEAAPGTWTSTSARPVESETRNQVTDTIPLEAALGASTSTSTRLVESETRNQVTNISPFEVAPGTSASTSAQPVDNGTMNQDIDTSQLRGARQTCRVCGEMWTWLRNTLRGWIFGPRGDIVCLSKIFSPN